MRIGIVGCNGVGAAHMVAAAKLGYEIVALMDPENIACLQIIDPDHSVINYHDEEGRLNYVPKLVDSFSEMKKESPDLIIIASPTDTHLEYLDKLDDFNNFVLVESPYGKSKSLKLKKVFVGYQWVHNPTIAANYITSIYYGSNSAPEHYDVENIVWDLASQALASVLKLKINQLTSADVKVQSYLNDVLEVDLVFDYSDIGKDYKQKVKMQIGYKSPSSTSSGMAISGDHDFTAILTDMDLFKNQLRAIENAINSNLYGPLVTTKEACILNQLCETIITSYVTGTKVTWTVGDYVFVNSY